MAGVEGLEPPTYRLTVYRSTNWTIHPSMRFVRLSSDRVKHLYHSTLLFTIDFRMTSPLAIWWHPDLRPHTAFEFTSNLRNTVRVASSPIEVFVFLEKNIKQNSSAGYLLPATNYLLCGQLSFFAAHILFVIRASASSLARLTKHIETLTPRAMLPRAIPGGSVRVFVSCLKLVSSFNRLRLSVGWSE